MPITAKRVVVIRLCPSMWLRFEGFVTGPSSALEARCRDAFDEVALEEQEEGEHRQEGERRHGEERTPIRHAGRVDEAAQPELHRVGADIVEIDERPEEIVPSEDEGEDRSRRERR